MFEFVTITGGVAVIRQEDTGHVYRFRPRQPGCWNDLRLDIIDADPDLAEVCEADKAAALAFAEGTAASVHGAAALTEPPWSAPLPRSRSLFSRRAPANGSP